MLNRLEAILSISPRKTIIALVAVSLVLPALATIRLLDHDNWVTAGNKIRWQFGDGRPLPKN